MASASDGESDPPYNSVDGEENPGEREIMTESSGVWRWFRELSVEPSLFLVAYAFSVYQAPFYDLLLRRICEETPEIPYQVCDALPDHPNAEELVHSKASSLLMVSSLVETVGPAVISVLAGVWSDRAGSRKPLIVIPLAGYVLKFALLAVIMGIPTLPVEYFLVAALPVAISGGWTTFFGAVTSVIGDETEVDKSLRTYRLGLIQVVYIIGIFPGSLTSSATMHALGHLGVFLLAGSACFLALIITLFTVSETYSLGNIDEGNQETCLLKDLVQTFIKKRANGRQACLILSILSLASSIMAYNGESNLYFLYGRKEFKWTVMDFTLYTSVSYGLQMVGTFFVVSFLSRKMNIADAPLAIISYLGASLGSIVRAFSNKTWIMYGGSAISLFHGAASPMMRSILSKSVQQNELGKVFTITTSLEALVPMAAQPLYTYVFRTTIRSFPGAFFVLSATMFFTDMIFSCIIHATQMRHSRPERVPLISGEDSARNLSE